MIMQNQNLKKKQTWVIWIQRYGFIVCIKIDDIHKDIAEDVETTFDLSNYEFSRPLTKQKNKKRNWINETWSMQKNYEKVIIT